MSLKKQWAKELIEKFLLEEQLGKSILIFGFDEISEIERIIDAAGMVVVDEAHHLNSNKKLY